MTNAECESLRSALDSLDLVRANRFQVEKRKRKLEAAIPRAARRGQITWALSRALRNLADSLRAYRTVGERAPQRFHDAGDVFSARGTAESEPLIRDACKALQQGFDVAGVSAQRLSAQIRQREREIQAAILMTKASPPVEAIAAIALLFQLDLPVEPQVEQLPPLTELASAR